MRGAVGGQKLFLAVHHLFLTPDGVYLVVFNTEELLLPPGAAMVCGNKVREDTRSKCLWYLREWFNSVCVFAPDAPVFIVGTCIDKMPEDPPGREAVCDAVCKTVWEEVLRMHPGQGQVVRDDRRRCCFFVDNTQLALAADGQPMRPEHPTVSHLRQRIGAVVRGQRHVEEKVPLNWLKVLDRVVDRSIADAEHVQPGVGVGTSPTVRPTRVTRDQVHGVARECGLGRHAGITLDDEVDALLRKFHDLGLVLW